MTHVLLRNPLCNKDTCRIQFIDGLKDYVKKYEQNDGEEVRTKI